MSSRNDLRIREDQILLLAAQVADTVLQNPHALRHLREGFVRRHMMIRVSRLHIHAVIESQRQGPLSIDLGTDLNIHLNSYYSNLCGALDNLAWTLAWELNLKTGLNEDDWESRKFCNLFGNDFLGSLDVHRPQLAKSLRQYEDWYREVRNLRDPGAHRIPLAFLGSVLEPLEVEKYRELYQQRDELLRKSLEASKEGNFNGAGDYIDKAAALMQIAESLGSFQPIIETSEASGRQIRSGADQIQVDQSNFLGVCKVVLEGISSSN